MLLGLPRTSLQASASIRLAVTTVVASALAFDRPVAWAIPGIQSRHMS